jgi:60 kDa SS-A/Ro ribonucleoprotein
MKYQDHFSTRQTPQSDPIPGREPDMAQNSAGGYAFPVDDWTRLDRFLILGSEGNTYYASERALTIENARAVMRCIQSDGLRTVKCIVEISEAGRAARNDPALFALAMCAGEGDRVTRQAALEALPRVARTGTHLFHFLDYVQAFRGWGGYLRAAVADWYNGKPADRLAYQVIKYRQRDGWSHLDALRLAHPAPATPEHNAIYAWLTGKYTAEHEAVIPHLIPNFLALQAAQNEKEVIAVLGACPDLPWETVPTQFLSSPQVWEVLLPRLPMTATFRNLGRMTANGLLVPISQASRTIAERITNQDALQKARAHPIQVLAALITYQSGHGARGRLTWQPVREIVDALDAAFYLSFGNVQPTDKAIMLALDVSGSMNSGTICGVPGLTPRIGSAAMSLITASIESQYMITIFSSGGTNFMKMGSNRNLWGANGLSAIDISPRQRLDDVVRQIDNLPFGGTDCALPVLYAQQNNLAFDAFIVYTDSETWAGGIHPVQALQEYRQRFGIPARLVVVGMVSNGFTIADPDDGGMLDVVGFDTATPDLISDFIG